MAKQMACVHYEVINPKTGATIIKNFGWFDSKESAKLALKKEYPRYIVTIQK